MALRQGKDVEWYQYPGRNHVMEEEQENISWKDDGIF